MGEIDARDIEAGADHPLQDAGIVSRRTERRDYLGSSVHGRDYCIW
jgi:hypothetical protein